MNLHMPTQIAFLSEAFCTNLTTEWFFLRVDSEVVHKIVVLGECATSVSIFANVNMSVLSIFVIWVLPDFMRMAF